MSHDGTTVTDLLRLGYSLERAEKDATHVLIPRAQHEALMAAAKIVYWLGETAPNWEISEVYADAREALAALLAAGIDPQVK